MSKSLEALKRLRQETAPATYIKDFDKKECCDVIERDLEMLDIVKKYLKNKSLELGIEDIIICCENEEDYQKIKEWLNNEKE